MSPGTGGPRPALILDADQRQALVAARALGRAGIQVFLAETHGAAPAFVSRWCAGKAVLPDFSTDERGFIDRLLELCESIGSPVVIPSHDGTIEALRARRAEVEQVAALALAAEPALAQAIDKRQTLAVAERLRIGVPPGVVVTEMSAADEAIAGLELPVVIKPVHSWIWDGGEPWRAAPRVARSAALARTQLQRLIDAGVPALVQTWLAGSREAVSTMFAQQMIWATFAQRADRMSPLIGGSSVLRESIPVPTDIGQMAEELVRAIELEGYAEIEFRRDARGRPFLMEINPRLSASVEIAVRAGVNFPVLLYHWAAAEPLRQAPGYRYGRRMRWLRGDIQWLKEAVREPEHPDSPGPSAAVAKFVTEFARRPGYDYWDRTDVRPALLMARRTVRELLGSLARRLFRLGSRRGP